MPRCLSLVSVAIALANAASAPPASAQGTRISASAPLRAIWAHASSTHSKAECDALLDRVQKAHLNCIYWLGFYWGGKCFFRNAHVPLPDTVAPGFDPLAYLIREGHRRGIEVHLRFVNGENGSREPGPFFGSNPEWRMADYEGRRLLWYDFANPEVRRFQADLMVRVVEDYPEIDGIQFDFIRYEDGGGSFSPAARRGFAEATGVDWPEGPLDSLPLVAVVRGNPLDGPTTAKILARFGDGIPAIATNDVGSGCVMLLNWHAELGPRQFVSGLLRRAIASVGVASGAIPMLRLPESQEWHAKYREAAESTIRAAGYSPSWVDASWLRSSAGARLLVVPNCYRINRANLEGLHAFVSRGGRTIVFDGPIHAINDTLAQTLFGFRHAPPYMASAPRAVVPVAQAPFMPVRDDAKAWDPSVYRELPSKWREFQAMCIRSLVEEVHRRAHEIRPDVTVSACVFHRRSSAESLLQYWHDWLRAGIIDYALPMAYTADNQSLRTSMREWIETDPSRARVVPGLGIYDIDGDGRLQTPEQVLTQMRVLREEGGYPGVVFFSYQYLSDALSNALIAGPFKEFISRGPFPAG